MPSVAGDLAVAINGPDGLIEARRVARSVALGLGFSPADVTMIVTAVSEVVQNIVDYANPGTLRLAIRERLGRTSLLVEATDHGPGITDAEQVLDYGFSTGAGLGLGLPGARRLVDHLELHSERGVGTRVTMWKVIPPQSDPPIDGAR